MLGGGLTHHSDVTVWQVDCLHTHVHPSGLHVIRRKPFHGQRCHRLVSGAVYTKAEVI